MSGLGRSLAARSRFGVKAPQHVASHLAAGVISALLVLWWSSAPSPNGGGGLSEQVRKLTLASERIERASAAAAMALPRADEVRSGAPLRPAAVEASDRRRGDTDTRGDGTPPCPVCADVAPPPACAPVECAPAAAAAPDDSELAALLAVRAPMCPVCAAPPPTVVPSAAQPGAGAWAMRGTARGIATYVKLALTDEISGFVNVPTYAAFAVITRAQRAAGVVGSVGEIGVHHGRSFILAALLSDPAEPLWVLDLFGDLQHLNVDGSGNGDQFALGRNLEKVGLHISNVTRAWGGGGGRRQLR